MTTRIVLYIEDNPTNLRLVQRILRFRPDIEFLGAPDGEGGLSAAVAVIPDLILLDGRLPGIGGPEVLRRLKSTPRTAAIPVVIVSGDTDLQQKSLMRRLGAAAYLVKPFELDELLAVTDEFCRPGVAATASR